jgi:hypothetical protein
MSDPITLSAVDAVTIPGRGVLHIVNGTPAVAEPDDLCGKEVRLGGAIVHVAAVETFAVGRPYPQTFPFGLLVAEDS